MKKVTTKMFHTLMEDLDIITEEITDLKTQYKSIEDEENKLCNERNTCLMKQINKVIKNLSKKVKNIQSSLKINNKQMKTIQNYLLKNRWEIYLGMEYCCDSDPQKQDFISNIKEKGNLLAEEILAGSNIIKYSPEEVSKASPALLFISLYVSSDLKWIASTVDEMNILEYYLNINREPRNGEDNIRYTELGKYRFLDIHSSDKLIKMIKKIKK